MALLLRGMNSCFWYENFVDYGKMLMEFIWLIAMLLMLEVARLAFLKVSVII